MNVTLNAECVLAGTYLPHGVEFCPLWHEVLPRLVELDLVMVDSFAVHERERKGAVIIFLPHPADIKRKLRHKEPEPRLRHTSVGKGCGGERLKSL